MTLQQLTKLIEDKRQELSDLETTARVLSKFNGQGKLEVMDKHVAAKLGKPTGETIEQKRERWRRNSQAKRDKAAAAGAPPANGPAPPFDLNQLPLDRLKATPWGGYTSFLSRTRTLILLDLMEKAGVPTTKANVDYVYTHVLGWGTRPLSQAQRYKLAKLTKKGWHLLPAGAEKVLEAQQILAAG